jgi:phosphoglycerol transferase MdoB-like AlkP superfamily enzyme
MGFEYLKTEKPRMIHFAFDETDDFAHHGSYDYYMNSARYTDDFIKQIWTWVQEQPQYRNQTTLLVTVDHGRGNTAEGWKSHGVKTEYSDETWFAVIGPDTPAKGEITSGQYFNKQYASTLAKLLGYDYTNTQTPGEIILPVLGK